VVGAKVPTQLFLVFKDFKLPLRFQAYIFEYQFIKNRGLNYFPNALLS